MNLFQNHPFAIEAFFTNSIVVTYAIPKENIRQLLPAFLEPDTFNEHAFIAAAIVQTKNLRPKGFPSSYVCMSCNFPGNATFREKENIIN